MAEHKKWRRTTWLVYGVLIAGIAWEAKGLPGLLSGEADFPRIHSVNIDVYGDVRRPGVYRVPEGTTQFELLEAAGIRPTSDLSGINLMSAVTGTDEIAVGSREQQVVLSAPGAAPRLESFFGDVTLTAKDGRAVPVQDGITIHEGDAVITASSSQAELALGSLSRVDLDESSEITCDSLSKAGEKGTAAISLFQKSGTCWYKLSSTEDNLQYRILTPTASITVRGHNADFLVQIQDDHISINCMNGLLYAEKNGGGESVNLHADQTVSMYKDERPFQISRLAADLGIAERFTQLSQAKTVPASQKNQPFNFLFCGTPYVFLAVSMQPDKNLVSVVHIPPQLLLGQLAPGVKTLDQAYLYGGPVFVGSIVERMLNMPFNNIAF